MAIKLENYDKDDKIINSVKNIKLNDSLKINVFDGKIVSDVKEIIDGD